MVNVFCGSHPPCSPELSEGLSQFIRSHSLLPDAKMSWLGDLRPVRIYITILIYCMFIKLIFQKLKDLYITFVLHSKIYNVLLSFGFKVNSCVKSFQSISLGLTISTQTHLFNSPASPTSNNSPSPGHIQSFLVYVLYIQCIL